MAKKADIIIHTMLTATADEVWAHAQTMKGVNYELAPWVRMSVPTHARDRSLADVTPGAEAFKSVLLFLAIIPFDVHHLVITELLKRGFVEESWSWMHRRWRHERRIEEIPGGCVVSDFVTITPRLAPRSLVLPIVRWIFRSRSKRLVARFGYYRP